MTDETRDSAETYRRDQFHAGDTGPADDVNPPPEESAATTGLGSVADQQGSVPTGEGPAPYTLREGGTIDDGEPRSESGI